VSRWSGGLAWPFEVHLRFYGPDETYLELQQRAADRLKPSLVTNAIPRDSSDRVLQWQIRADYDVIVRVAGAGPGAA